MKTITITTALILISFLGFSQQLIFQEHCELDSNKQLNGLYLIKCNDHLLTKGYYQNGEQAGKWNHYNLNGQKTMVGYYANGLKDGIWNYYRNDEIICQLTYNNDKLNGEVKIYDNKGKAKVMANYQNGILVSKKKDVYDFGNETFFIVDIMPRFLGQEIAINNQISKDMINTGATNFHTYLKQLLDNITINSEGIVFVQFTVGLLGEIEDVKMIRGFSNQENEEIMNLFRSLPAFEPGFLNGLPARVSYVQPIKF